MLALLALLATSTELAVERRQPFWVAVSVPSKQFAAGSLSDLIRGADEAIRSVTDLRGVVVPDQAIVDCSDRPHLMGCLARRVRSERTRARFLLMVSTFDESRIVAVLADLDAGDGVSSDETDVDRILAEKVIVGVALPVLIGDLEALRAYLEELLSKHVAAFDRADARGKLGALEIESSVPASITIDGKQLGRIEGRTRVADLTRGPHIVRIEEAGYEDVELPVDIQPSEVARVSAMLRSTQFDAARDATLYGGIGVIAVGIGLGAAGLVLPSRTCLGDDCPASFRHVLIPVGYSAIGMGVAWALGAWLGDEDSFPWIELVAGIGVFGASLGLSLGLDGRCTGSCTDLTGI